MGLDNGELYTTNCEEKAKRPTAHRMRAVGRFNQRRYMIEVYLVLGPSNPRIGHARPFAYSKPLLAWQGSHSGVCALTYHR
ncbi:Hypothetical protein CGLY_04980 [Corynebacterium glyciniphilum AJ 3170]|uniref:Transposase n=1 Tax=Corynebacterium glyciniphilum AJ 3170 TaxID=1404245 RepID=X5DQ72_9CORY|nr:Hypothetical protein CGLY_04980 [Corynebacterium glyciniphilum AJ 3170]